MAGELSSMLEALGAALRHAYRIESRDPGTDNRFGHFVQMGCSRPLGGAVVGVRPSGVFRIAARCCRNRGAIRLAERNAKMAWQRLQHSTTELPIIQKQAA